MILLDTCVISEVARDNPDARVSGWFETVQEERLRLSVISVGEIQKGIEMLQPGARQDQLRAWLEGLVDVFHDRILPIDEPVARRWGTIAASTQRIGRPRPPIDALLAATAIHHDLVLATRNVADFEGTGVRLVNPWRPAEP